jgi:hypothetical protein
MMKRIGRIMPWDFVKLQAGFSHSLFREKPWPKDSHEALAIRSVMRPIHN